MITDLLLRHAALVPLLLLAVAFGSATIGLALLHRGHRRAIAATLGVAIVGTLALTLSPASEGRAFSTCAVQFSLPDLGTVELLANVALFIPIGCFATLLTRRPLLSLVGASLGSAAIEAIQAALPAVGRACDTNDWSMNTGGALLGVLIAAAALAVDRRRPAT